MPLFKIEYIKYLYNFWRFKKKQKKNRFTKKKLEFIEKKYNQLKKKKKLIIATQVGRGGGKWLADMINSTNGVYAYGERNRIKESYFRYLRSFKDKSFDKSMLKIIKSEAINDWEDNYTSYISSPYFSHGLDFLDKELKPDKIVVLVPSFKHLIISFKNKNWYNTNNFYYHKQRNIPKEFKNNPNHFYGRYINLNLSKKIINQLTQLQKISVFVNQTLEKIFKECKKIDKKKIEIFDLQKADQNYSYCKKFLKKIDIDLSISRKKFISLKHNTSRKYENKKIFIDTSEINWIEEKEKQYNKIKKKLNFFKK